MIAYAFLTIPKAKISVCFSNNTFLVFRASLDQELRTWTSRLFVARQPRATSSGTTWCTTTSTCTHCTGSRSSSSSTPAFTTIGKVGWAERDAGLQACDWSVHVNPVFQCFHWIITASRSTLPIGCITSRRIWNFIIKFANLSRLWQLK